MKTLKDILKTTEYSAFGNKEKLYSVVTDIAYDSRKAKMGSVFVCLCGERTDGHGFALDAYLGGARIFICERKLPLNRDALQIIVADTRVALALISAEFFSHPEKKLKIIGVTGTKGKTSVCAMITHIMELAGKKAGSIGTVGIKMGDLLIPTENSTPESYIIYKNLAEMVALGMEYAVLEVSSQSVFKRRIDGIRFSAAVYTNLSADHIGNGEHPDFEHYKECKKRIFHRTDTAFLNADDLFASEFAADIPCPVYCYGIESPCDVYARSICRLRERGLFGVSFRLIKNGRTYNIKLPLPGKFSVYNALAAISVCTYFGIAPEICARAIYSVRIKGRCELVAFRENDAAYVIDYAHNAQSLSAILKTLREYEPKRIICLFGSVGGRSLQRRREMALTASELADICIVTCDNPDTESADDIISEMASYIRAEKCICITDREDAVKYAVRIAQSGDFVVFAGKGHEEYQLINGKKLPFSERELIEKYAFGGY